MSGVRLELLRRERRLDPPVANARGAWTERCTIELRLGDAAAFGLGEAAPLPEYSPEGLDDCERALAALDPARFEALGAGSPRALLDAAAAALPPELPAARFALETALLDRAGRRSGKPLWRLLRELVPEAEARETVPLCALLPSGQPAQALEFARRHQAAGVIAFKLKVGPERLGGAQQATLEALRREFGAAVALRVDANRSLSRADLKETLSSLARHEVEFVEEPLEAPTLDELAQSPCPIALDESLQSLADAELARLLELETVRVVVLKPTALGGFGRCISLAGSARAHGCEAVVSQTLEGPIGWAAAAHLALALPGARAAGLAPLAHQSTALPRIARGQLLPPTEPGLGASLEAAAGWRSVRAAR